MREVSPRGSRLRRVLPAGVQWRGKAQPGHRQGVRFPIIRTRNLEVPRGQREAGKGGVLPREEHLWAEPGRTGGQMKSAGVLGIGQSLGALAGKSQHADSVSHAHCGRQSQRGRFKPARVTQFGSLVSICRWGASQGFSAEE